MKELVARYKKTTGCEAEVRDFFAAMERLSEMMIHDIYTVLWLKRCRGILIS
jgi:hypothetical protein